MLVYLLATGIASLILALLTIFRPADKGASAWFAFAITSTCTAIWIFVDVLPGTSGNSRVLAAAVLGAFTAGAALWLRAAIGSLRMTAGVGVRQRGRGASSGT